MQEFPHQYIGPVKNIACASKLEWNFLLRGIVGAWEKVERVLQFAEFQLKAELNPPAGGGRQVKPALVVLLQLANPLPGLEEGIDPSVLWIMRAR